MQQKVEITVLGSGTSQGVPVITCECDVCLSTDSKDNRLRSSMLIRVGGENFVIDTGPDFRQQMLREKVKSLRGVLFTHEHKDHVAGLDDVRAFNYGEGRDMEVYCSEAVEFALRREFHYVFSGVPYPGIPTLHLNRIVNEKFQLIDGVEVKPIQVMHYRMPVFGFRIGDFTYITDAKTVSIEEMEKVKGSKVLIVNCLHRSQHISHFNLEEALAFIEAVKPEKAYLTHISHLFGKHADIEKDLPENVYLAFDGLKLEV
ncbi:MAG: MBL fold metallo-hydrolase [Crocinitomicaceae bacterium]|nr:MBL fold metallo-hydrolase [Crocinitomicaceae bacterium]